MPPALHSKTSPFSAPLVPLALDSAALQTSKPLPRAPGNRPRRQNRFASSDDPDFPEATAYTAPQTAPCFARHSFCSPPPNLFRVRLFDSLNAKEMFSMLQFSFLEVIRFILDG